MGNNKIDKTPFLLVAIVLLAFFFLSCTKKTQPQAAAQNYIPTYTTSHGFKVQFEQVTAADQAKPAAPQQIQAQPPEPRAPASK